MRRVSVSSLRPGMKVARPVYDSSGFLLLNSGLELKREYIENLKKLEIPALFIVDNLIPDVDIDDVILDETRKKANQLIKNIIMDIEKQPAKSISKWMFADKSINNVLNDIVDQLLDNSNLVINLADIRTADNYTFSHSVNVAVLAITTGISLGLSRSRLHKIGFGSLLHDLGKIKIPLWILNKNGSLSVEEFEEIKKHPRYGYDMVRMQDYMDISSALIIYQHHERINGKGYPEGLTSEQIHLFSKIGAIADVYDALVSDRPYRSAFPPHEAFHFLQSGGEEYDQNILQKFFNNIAAYPVGTILSLSNETIGVVVHNTAGFPTRPKVRIICSESELELLEPTEIDLMHRLNIVVKKVYSENDIPENIKKIM
ncbi:MAG: HD-GYP domain-containing protein [Bacillota bacterium]|nr:HD-GYP domain-containing protein [Bacillota bacterium]